MNRVRIQGDGGRFEQKGDEPRRNRMITLTDTAWARLEEVAKKRGVSRSDLIETLARSIKPSDQKPSIIDASMAKMNEVLADESVVRKRDRAAVRRAILAMLGR